MQREEKQSQIYGIEILQMSKCRDEESKLKYTELQDYRCKYTETEQVK